MDILYWLLINEKCYSTIIHCIILLLLGFYYFNLINKINDLEKEKKELNEEILSLENDNNNMITVYKKIINIAFENKDMFKL